MRTVALIFFPITIIGFIKQTSAADEETCPYTDKKAECPSWASKGYCNVNRPFMQYNCGKTCNCDVHISGPRDTTTTPTTTTTPSTTTTTSTGVAESIFLIGGWTGTRRESSVETKPVCSVASLPIQLSGHVAFTTPDNHHLVCGGWDSNTKCFEYNSDNNAWSYHSTTEYGPYLSEAVVMSKGSYIFSSSNSPKNAYLFLPIGSKIWTPKKNMPWPAMFAGCGVATDSTNVLLIGGYYGGKSLWIFNTDNDVWTELPENLPQALTLPACIKTDEGILITGGKLDAGWYGAKETTTFKQTWLFDTVSKSFTSSGDFNNARFGHQLVRNNGKTYAIGGAYQDKNTNDVYSSIEEWDPSTKTWKTTSMTMDKPRMNFVSLNFKHSCSGCTATFTGTYTYPEKLRIALEANKCTGSQCSNLPTKDDEKACKIKSLASGRVFSSTRFSATGYWHYLEMDATYTDEEGNGDWCYLEDGADEEACPYTDKRAECPSWASRGYCNGFNGVYRPFMQYHCGKTCNCQ